MNKNEVFKFGLNRALKNQKKEEKRRRKMKKRWEETSLIFDGF